MFRILVVDDEKNIRFLLRETLLLEGYTVLLAGNGREAPQKVPTGSRVSLSKTRDCPNSGEADEVHIGVVVHNSGSPNPGSEILAPGCRRQKGKWLLPLLKTLCALVSSIAKWS